MPDLTQQISDAKNKMAACDPCHSHSLTVAPGSEGSMKVDEQIIFNIPNKKSSNLVEWIPNHRRISWDIPPHENVCHLHQQ